MVNLFFKRLFGQIPSTEKYVKQSEGLRKEMNDFDAFSESDKLKRYQELEAIIQGAEHQETKRKLQEMKYPGSEEHRLETEYQVLAKNKDVQLYLKVQSGADLPRYKEVGQSKKYQEYSAIKRVVDSGEIEKSKQQLNKEHHEELALEKRFQKLSSDSTLKTYFKLIQSPEYANYRKVENSEKLAQFQVLKKEVEGFNYKQITNANKEQFQSEIETRNRFLALDKDSDLKAYFKFVRKQQPQFIEKVSASQTLHDYNDLKTYLESAVHKQKLEETSFENSEMAQLLAQYKKLLQDPDIRFYLKFETSKELKTYKQIEGSQTLERYNELQEYINSEEFKTRKQYLSDPKKFEKSEGYEFEQELRKLKADPETVWYFKLLKSNKFDSVRQWNPIFEETFETLDSEKWLNIPFQGMLNLNGKSYVPEGNMQFHTEGKNLRSDNNCLTIETRQEKTSGLRWQISSGFKMRDFDYTSGMVNTGHNFRIKGGKIEILARMTSYKEVVHALFLKSESIAPHIDVFCTGSKKGLKARLFLTNQTKPDFEETIAGINPESNFMYSLEWNVNKLTWQINGFTVAEYNGKLPENPLYLGLSSVLLNKPQNLPANLVVDTIRVYERAN
jgi:hypothetical protein